MKLLIARNEIKRDLSKPSAAPACYTVGLPQISFSSFLVTKTYKALITMQRPLSISKKICQIFSLTIQTSATIKSLFLPCHLTPAFRLSGQILTFTQIMSASSSSTTQNSHNQNWQNSQMSSFSGQMLQNATLNNCTITMNHYKCSPVQKRRRICVIDNN